MGWTQEEIAEVVGLSQQRVQQITNNAGFGEISNLLAQGRDMPYIARHYSMDLALAWALRLGTAGDRRGGWAGSKRRLQNYAKYRIR